MLKAKELMNSQVVSIAPEEGVCEAMRLMALNHITGLPVVAEDGLLVGMITEKDLLGLLYHNLEDPGMDRVGGKVGEYMTRNVVCFDAEDSLEEIVECLSMRNFRRVPILSRGRLVGIISRRDIIRHLTDLQRQTEVARDNILELLY
jgi:CBS domain-containing protein